MLVGRGEGREGLDVLGEAGGDGGGRGRRRRGKDRGGRGRVEVPETGNDGTAVLWTGLLS